MRFVQLELVIYRCARLTGSINAKDSIRRYDVEQLDIGEERSQQTMTKELMYCLINNILSSI